MSASAKLEDVFGVVSEVRVHLVVDGGGAGRDTPVSVRSREVLTFVVTPAQGPTTSPPSVVRWVPRRSRLIAIPPVAVGDTVRVSGHRRRGLLSAAQIENLSQNRVIEGRSRPRALGVLLVAGFVTAFVAIGVAVIAGTVASATGHHQSAHVVVPSLNGLDEQTAFEQLERLSLLMSAQLRSDPSIPFGHVVSSSPGAGVSVQAGTSISVLISCGPSDPPICT